MWFLHLIDRGIGLACRGVLYLTLTGHKYESNPFLMGKRSWDKLSPADQQAFKEAAAEATQLQRKLSKESDDKLLAELKGKGVQVDTVDRKAFIDATKPVYDKWSNGATGEFVKRVVQQAHAQ
jgi:TRAP-type C4-dicarboxylate transport system substrate-binding protein